MARDVIDVAFALDPSLAANAGLFEDAVRVPSFAPRRIRALVARLDGDLAAMRKMPWRSWPVDRQIDFRWIYANAETAKRILVHERGHLHRPATWLEPAANNLIAFASYAPTDQVRPARIWALFPDMLAEMRAECRNITRRDQETARRLLAALITMAEGSGSAQAAAVALKKTDEFLLGLTPEREFEVIGAESYAWRLRHALLLDLPPEKLLAVAEKELVIVDAELAELQPKVQKAAPTAAQKQRAARLTRDDILGLYDAVSRALHLATLQGGFITVPDGVGPIHARETPEAMVPLTGDGGSMNPPPPFVDSQVGFWNVERFSADWPFEEKLELVTVLENFSRNGMGPYAAHEGWPGHHLQLAIARLHSNPIRILLGESVFVEGWGLYAEEELWRHGGLGTSLEARAALLRSYRYRIARVVYDVNIETGKWDLQVGADFKQKAAPGKGKVDEDVLRSIQWPTQLISYFTGKMQILALKEELRRKQGTSFSDRAFHDALLAEGSIPVSLIRAKLLGEPVPGI